MAKYRCDRDCFDGTRFYQVGLVYDAAAEPIAGYFTLAGDVLSPGPGWFRTDLDKTLYLPGEGWDDLNFTATGINPPGAASDPTRDTTTGLLSFSGSQDNIIAGVAQMKHHWKLGSAIVPHLHVKWADANAGTADWRLQYKTYNPVGDVPAGYTTIDVSAASPGAGKAGIISFGLVPMLGLGVSAHVEWLITRLGSSDSYASAVVLTDLDFHFQIDSLGSGQEYSK